MHIEFEYISLLEWILLCISKCVNKILVRGFVAWDKSIREKSSSNRENKKKYKAKVKG